MIRRVRFSVNYNDFAQSIQTYQAQGGAVNGSSTPSVQYGYASGSANTIRPTSLESQQSESITHVK